MTDWIVLTVMEKIVVESKLTSGSPFSRGAQHEAKRAAILSRAAKLFNTKGARSTTLADVADKLGLTKTSLYYYVKTKEDLIYQCYQSAMARLTTGLNASRLLILVNPVHTQRTTLDYAFTAR